MIPIVEKRQKQFCLWNHCGILSSYVRIAIFIYENNLYVILSKYIVHRKYGFDQVTDYLHIIKQPMDLETMMTKVDLHKYNCAKEFLDDIDLICANALEYNPDR